MAFFFLLPGLVINFIKTIIADKIQQYNYTGMSTIAVCIRLRPFLQHQRLERTEKSRIYIHEESNQVKVQLTEQKEKNFKFNHVFGPEVSQLGVYKGIEALSLVERVVEGYHSTIFAYGQTGSGKTFTIDGSEQEQNEGIVPKAIRDLYKTIEQKTSNDRGYKIFISFIQIYNESIYDLIDPNDGKPLKMRWNKYQQFTVQNMFEGQCRSAEEALKWWNKGRKNKIMGSHKMNNTSSRSHCLLTLRVQSYLLQDPSQQIESKLEIVDLAGSERQKVTKSTGVVFKEGIQINKSLFTLRQVIASLYETSTTGKSNLPPYRDSKLTSLLKQSIGGNSYCLMIACLNPTMAHFEQSLQTLTYASMASYISNIPVKNVDPKLQQNAHLRQQNVQLQQHIKKLEDHIQYLTKLVETNECLECKKKNSVLRKTQPTFQREVGSSPQPTGLLVLTNKQIASGFSNEIALPSVSPSELKQMPSEKIYEKIVKQRNPNSQPKTLKSTKEIIESIAMIRDLINANSTLREKIETLKEVVQKQERQTFALMKENQILRDRWDMISTSVKPESQAVLAEEAPIAAYERMLRQQRGEGLKLHSLNTQSSKLQTQGQYSKMSYNQFLKGGNKKLASLKTRTDVTKRRNRINSQSKRTGHDSYY